MQKKSDKIAFQVKFWSLIAQTISLFVLFAYLFKGSVAPLHLPLALLVGVFLSWHWKLWGVAATSSAVLLILGMTYGQIPLNERFWFIGMGLSVGLSVLITSLCFEETEGIISEILVESRSRLENLWKLDEKLQEKDEDLKKKRERIRELNTKVRSFQKVIDLSAQDLTEARASRDALAQDLASLKSERDLLRQQLTRGEEDVVAQEQYDALKRELEETRLQLAKSEQQVHAWREQLELRVLADNDELETILSKHFERVEKEHNALVAEHQQELDALQSILESGLSQAGENSPIEH